MVPKEGRVVPVLPLSRTTTEGFKPHSDFHSWVAQECPDSADHQVPLTGQKGEPGLTFFFVVQKKDLLLFLFHLDVDRGYCSFELNDV